jgi:F-box-like
MEDAHPSYSTNEPAIKLVDDILEYIFLLNATLPDSEHATTVASSQVCTRWRSIALNCHTIWGRIIDYRRHSLKWIEKLLDRSNPSLLDFGSRNNCVYLEDDRQGVLELVFNHIDRLRIFNLHRGDLDSICQWELVCSRFLQLPAPNLEFIHVLFSDVAGHLTHPLFDNHAPNLQNVGLSRCSVDFTSPVLTSLIDLFVCDIHQPNTVPTVLDWLNILGGMPSL